MNTSEPTRLLRVQQICALSGKGRSSVYQDIAAGLLTQPISIGSRAVAIPAREIEAILRARIRGANERELRELVTQLHAQRSELDATASGDW
jgi:prophage regulatory protein